MAKYLWKQDAFRTKIISFETDIQGFILEYLDKIKISHSALMWGQAGEVYEVSGSNVKVSEAVDVSSNITFRNIDGSVSDMLSFTKIDEYNITVTNLPTWVQDGTAYTIGEAKEFLVVGIKPKSEDTVTVECVSYSEDIYT